MNFYLISLHLYTILHTEGKRILSESKIQKEITATSQKCFVSFLQYEAISPKCDGFNSPYPKYMYKKDDISVLFSNKTNFKNSFYTSAWCSSSDVSGLRCKFDNLCYLPLKKKFIYISSTSSVLYGVNSLLELSTQLFSSSVRDHNAFQVPFAAVNISRIQNSTIKFVHRKSLLFSRFKPDNLQHIFHDDLLPLYFTIQELSNSSPTMETRGIATIVIDDFGTQEYDFLYKGVTKELYFKFDFPSDLWICFSEAYIGLNRMSVFYDYNFSEVTDKKYLKYLNTNHLDAFVSSFARAFHLYTRPNREIEDIKLVMIQRKRTRKILNLNDIEISLHNFIKQKTRVEPIIKIMSLEDDGVISIIKELQTTKILIGMHGAALVLSLFMPQSSSLIELWPYGLKPTVVSVYKILCEIKGINYKFWINEDVHNSKVHPEYPLYYGGIENWNPKDYPNVISKLKSSIVEKIMCCDNPEWLLRIYQDTLVNVYSNANFQSKLLQDSIDSILKTANDESTLLSAVPSNHQYLSQVEDACCDIYHDELGQTKVILGWNIPWNYEDIGCKEVSFEITLKEININGKESIQFYYTQERVFLKKFLYKTSPLHVWITSLCGEEQGGVVFIHCK